MNGAADIAEEWLAEEAETSPWSRRVRVRISLHPTGARSLPDAGPRRRLRGAKWTRMKKWTSATRRSPHPRTHRGDPAETHRDLLAEARQDPVEDAHQVDPTEADRREGEDPLDRAGPAEALLEDPLGTPTTHQGSVTRMPPGGGLSTSAGGSSTRARGRHGKGEMIRIARIAAGPQKELDIAKTEMVKIAKVATAAQGSLTSPGARPGC